MKFAFLALLFLVPFRSALAAPGGTQADYARAAALRETTADKVFRDRVEPHWIGNQGLWYRVRTAAGRHEFVRVDIDKAARSPAFDHARLAEAMRKASLAAEADRLPIEDLDFDAEGRFFDFRTGGSWWRCRLPDHAIQRRPGGAPRRTVESLRKGDPPRATRGTGDAVDIAFANRTAAPLELFWLDFEGNRRSYGQLAPGQEHSLSTFAGHVWLFVAPGGKIAGWYEAGEKAATVEIGPTPPPGEPGRAKVRETPIGPVSPDGRWTAAIKNHNVWVRGSEELQLSRDGTADDGYIDRFHWSPDSKKLVVVRRRPAQEHLVYFVESSPRDQVQPKLHSHNYLKPGDRVDVDKPRLFDLVSRREIPVDDKLFADPWSVGDVRWAGDSSRFTFVFNERGHQALRLLAVDAVSGEVRPSIDERSPTFIDYSGKFYLHYLDDTNEAIWMSERDGWNHLYLYDTHKGEVKAQITRGPWVVRGVERVDPVKRQVWFRAGGIRPGQDPYYVHHARVNFDGTGLVVLTEADGTHRIDWSPDRRFFVDQWSRVDLPPTAELRRGEDGSRVCELERADASALLATGWRPAERFTAKGRDGQTDIFGLIYRPSRFDPQAKYPVIEEIYAGPQGAMVPKAFQTFTRAQALAELGFVIVQIDGMGTSHRSKKFHDVCWKNLADAGFPDRISWLRAAAAERPWMDLSRVGIFGGSAGGQNAACALMTHGDFYKVAVADCGCHDNRMDKIWWNEQWMGRPVGPHYAANSNVTLAPRLQGKLLLIVGEMDTNVDPASTMQVVDALVKADKDFELLILPGAGHGSAESPYGSRRRADFFVRHLLGVEPRRP